MKNIPWVEKYRPNDFNDIVLDKYNKIILENIVNKNDFPNPLPEPDRRNRRDRYCRL